MDILGLPLHPLVVHLVVIALPVGALATVAAVVSPTVRTRYAPLALATLTLGTLGAAAAKFSGEDLAETVTLPERHATLGNATLLVAVATAALGWLWWWLDRRQAKAPAGTASFATMLAGGVLATAALALTVLTVLTGHAGAQATWSTRLAADAAPAAAQPAAPTTYTLADVAEHATPEDCWAAIDGGVYDLTSWVALHPGGGNRIQPLCGTDATAQFSLQHQGEGRPNAQLAAFRIGDLG